MRFWLSLRRPTGPGGARKSPQWLPLACLLALLAVAGSELRRWSEAHDSATPVRMGLASPQKLTLTERASSLIPMPPHVSSAHASSMAHLPGGQMIVFWWAGSRESAPDVKVYASRWADGKWDQPWEVATRASLGKALGFGVRRIGNPVAWTSADGKIHLYVVATGMGGWAASRIVQLVSSDLGDNFKVTRVLPMSPLFNTSSLVRTTPVGMANGGWLLPLYFELGIKYPVLLAFDKRGDPSWLTRIGTSTSTLQPAIVPTSGSVVHAWSRDSGAAQRVQHAQSSDGGVSWADMPALDLPNQNTSLSALRLKNGSVLMLHNHVVPGGSSRNMLRLSIARDASHWTPLADVARGEAGEEFSYPDMQVVGNQLHITYTSRRKAIAHHIFDMNFEGVLE